MSRGWAGPAGALLAAVCGVCGAYSTLAPELQKQQAERLAKEFTKEHGNDTAPAIAPPITVSNDASIGASVRDVLQEGKAKAASASASVKEAVPAKRDHPQKQNGGAWGGLSMFKWGFGGPEKPEDDTASKLEQSTKSSKS